MANVRIWLASQTALESMMSNLYVFRGYYLYALYQTTQYTVFTGGLNSRFTVVIKYFLSEKIPKMA